MIFFAKLLLFIKLILRLFQNFRSSIFGPQHTITSPNGVHQLAINGPGRCCFQVIPGNLVSFEVNIVKN